MGRRKERALEALEQVDGWRPGRVAVGVVAGDGVVATRGDVDEEFRWASLTKPVTALAVLRLVADGVADLDEPAGPEGATVRHLLAHASGLPTDGSRPIAKPGDRRIYSNSGYELLGDLVEGRTHRTVDVALRELVLEPLAMARTHLAGSPAHGCRGPLGDLLALAHELLAPALIPAELHATATTVAFPGLKGVLPGFGQQDPNDWGLGVEIRATKQPHWTGSRNSPATFGHFGRSGSFVWVDPEAGVACAGLADTDFGPWASEAWPKLADAVLDELR